MIVSKVLGSLVANTFDNWCHCPDFNRTAAGELSDNHFKKIERLSDEQQNYQVRNKKSSAAIFEGRKRETPDVAQAY